MQASFESVLPDIQRDNCLGLENAKIDDMIYILKPETRQQKCLFACILETLGIMDEKGVFSIATAVAKFAQTADVPLPAPSIARVTTLANTCIPKVNKSERCERAAQLAEECNLANGGMELM